MEFTLLEINTHEFQRQLCGIGSAANRAPEHGADPRASHRAGAAIPSAVTGKNPVKHFNLTFCQCRGAFPGHSHEGNKVYIKSLHRNPDSPCSVPQFLSFPSLCSGSLGQQQQQQQHPVCRVCVSASPRLVQSPSTRPFPPHSQIFPQPRAFPALV